MSVDKLSADADSFTFKETEQIEHAAYILVPGDYSNLTSAYNFLGKWIEDNNYTICGNARQATIKGPWNENNPSDYLS